MDTLGLNETYKKFPHFKEPLQFLISNKEVPTRKVDKVKLKDSILVFFEASNNGLPAEIIKILSFSLIYQDYYDISTRRKLLYSCIPISDFPYEVIPLAVSSAALPNISSTWQSSIVSWLSGLLQFQIISESHKMVHACYPALFNMMGILRTCGMICKILNHITKREDVTPYRVQILLRLQKRIGFSTYVPHLLRTYQMFRPDLVVLRLDRVKRLPSIPQSLQVPMLNAKLRFEGDSTEQSNIGQDLWPQYGQTGRSNPFHEPNVITRPEILVYADTIEEKKEKKISVLQYRRIKDMIKNVSKWKDWRWPNSASCLLWKPSAIALFKPHDASVKVSITNWLEHALRSEVIEQLGNPSRERQDSLLHACVLLVKHNETLVPAVYLFLIEFFTKWDKYSHMTRILELLSFMPFVSPSTFFETILEGVSHILKTASLSLFCAFVNTFSNMAMTWALQAHREAETQSKMSSWPHDSSDVFSLEGINFLSIRLERLFIATVLRIGPHPMLLNACISFFVKVNFCLEDLNLPMFLVPSPEFILLTLGSSSVVATHRLGKILANMRERADTVKNQSVSEDEKLMRSVALSHIESINFSVMVLLDSTVNSKGFCSRWLETLSSFVSPSFIKSIGEVRGLKDYGSVTRSLAYVPYSIEPFVNTSHKALDTTMKNEITEDTLYLLKRAHMDGILSCAVTYMPRSE